MKAVKPKRKRAPKIKGIGTDAETLGVTRQHLCLVVHGKRSSPKLLAKYTALRRNRNAKG